MISIIISLYQSDRYLGVFSRHVKNFAGFLEEHKIPFELIVIANEPTENEKCFAADFVGQNWFKFFSVSRESLYASWNRGAGLAGGELLGFWNVDDIRYPEAILEARDLFAQGAELVYFPFKICRYLKIFGQYFFVFSQTVKRQIPEYGPLTENRFLHEMHCGPFFLFKKSLYQKTGPFDEQFKIAGDFDWCARAAKAGGKFVKAAVIAGEFRVDGTGLSAGRNDRRAIESNVVCLRNGYPALAKTENRALEKEYRIDLLQYKGQYTKI